jgi:hypothetical protein
VRSIEMAARIDCNFAGRWNIATGSVASLTCADFRSFFVAGSAQAFRVMFGVPASSSSTSFAIGFTLFVGALAARSPAHVANFKMSGVDPAQNHPGWPGSQVIPEFYERAKTKLDSAGAVILPQRILRVRAAAFRTSASRADLLATTRSSPRRVRSESWKSGL